MDAAQFREKVLGILKEEFVDEDFQNGSRDDIVQWGDTEISVQNLHAELAIAEMDEATARSIIVEHFVRVLGMIRNETQIIPPTWEEAKTRVRLQLMLASFRNDFSVTYPFLDDVLISVVVDAEHGYAFIRQEDLERWDINSIDLYETARDNLEEASRNLDVSYVAGPPSLLALGTQDGYDAARILLPRLREFAADRLGSPFLAGIPNRDFLIMWSEDDEGPFSENIKLQLQEDSRMRPHPLTARILRVTEDTIEPIL